MPLPTTATIETTLSALARIDDGGLTVTIDPAIYSSAAVHAALPEIERRCEVRLHDDGRQVILSLTPKDNGVARLQIGEALTALLRCSIQYRL